MNFEEINFDELLVSKEELEEWYEANKDLVKEARDVWVDLETMVISAVENPAHDSDFLSLKSDEKGEELEYVFKNEDDKQIAYAPVMVPDQLDAEGDLVPAPIVRKAAHQFLEKKKNDEIDKDHESRFASESISKRGTVVESWTLDESKSFETVNGETKEYPEGTWMAKVKFKDNDTWEQIKNGEITGYSIQGRPEKLDEATKYIKEDTQDTGMSENTESEGEVTVSVNKSELVEDIAEQVSEQVDVEPETETKEVEVYPDFDEYVDSEEVEVKQIDTQDLYGLVADHLEVEVSEVSDALAPLDGSESEETEEEDEDENEEEETETESEEKDETETEQTEETEDEVTRNASEKSQTTKEETETTESNSDVADLWDLE